MAFLRDLKIAILSLERARTLQTPEWPRRFASAVQIHFTKIFRYVGNADAGGPGLRAIPVMI